MANTVLNEVVAIRSLLNDSLPQSPSFEDVLEAMEAEYANATNITNNTPNAWQRDVVSFTTVAGQREYQILTDNDDFDKPLVVLTVPDNIDQFPEYQLEFVEVQYLSQEWAWLGQNRGSLFNYSSHDSQLCAVYHKLGDDGDEVWVELRPTPTRVQTYKIMYAVTDWWSRVFATQDTGYGLPYKAHKNYFRAQIAENLLYKCKWSMDKTNNLAMKQEIGLTLQNTITRFKPAFDQWVDSLVVPDITEGEAWADTWDRYAI